MIKRFFRAIKQFFSPEIENGTWRAWHDSMKTKTPRKGQF